MPNRIYHGQPRSLRHLAMWVVGLVVISAVLWGIEAVLELYGIDVFSHQEEGDPYSGIVTEIFVLFMFVGCGVVEIVAYLLWQYRAAKNLRILEFEGMKFSPGWGVGWWFIPVANFFQPPRIVSEIYRRSGARTISVRTAAGVASLVLIWWGLTLWSLVVDFVRYIYVDDETGQPTTPYYWLGGIGLALYFAAQAIAVTWVLRITKWQEDLLTERSNS